MKCAVERESARVGRWIDRSTELTYWVSTLGRPIE